MGKKRERPQLRVFQRETDTRYFEGVQRAIEKTSGRISMKIVEISNTKIACLHLIFIGRRNFISRAQEYLRMHTSTRD